MSFNDAEIAYLRSQALGRLATVAEDGQPDVVPVAVEFDGSFFWVGGGDPSSVLATRKFRNVAAGERRVALVVDDLVSLDRSSLVACGFTEPLKGRWSGSA